MYPPNHAKVPPVRPRSSLSADEHHRIKETHLGRCRRKEPSNALLTLAGFCIFLFVLCAFLLGALVYVGRQIAEENAQRAATNTYGIGVNLTDADGRFAYAIPSGDDLHNQLLLSTKPIVNYRPTVPQTAYNTTIYATQRTPLPTSNDASSTSTLSPLVLAKSKILNQLSFRLPRELRPKQYRLHLQLDLKRKSFMGNLTIRFEVLKPISFIPLHSKLLTVTTEELQKLSEYNEEPRVILPSLTFEYPEMEYWVTEFEQPLEVGEYALRLRFNSSLTDRIVGFYQSSYFDEERKEKRWIATSKFEPTFARQAFPCFDEPSMKATFLITMVYPNGDNYHALSNMNVENERIMDNLTEVTFAESVPMSTYLVCFLVSDFVHQSKMVKGVLEGAKDFEMRVYSTPAQINKVKFALDSGVAIAEYYIKYFNISYPLPKLDMAAIPDFLPGAMEHWGLVTYRETALLFEETISSSANKQRVATVVAHELAHMWFGNLVTMKWWNDLWLNEGFASYIEYKGMNAVYPEWKMLDQFLIEDLHRAMELDATFASHPIVQIVDSPSRIFELFDSITYSKGASIIRMLEDVVGEVKFRNATENYLNKFFYENAETDDFLTEIETQEFDYDIKLIIQTWVEQMGFPVIEVTQNETVYTLTQRRFFSNPEDYNYTYSVSTFNYRWSIPITYFTSASSEIERTIFNYNDQEITINVNDSVDWIKLNKNQMGYYRVNYPIEIWRQLVSTLISSPQTFSVSDRAHLLSDAFALADAAQLNFSIALNLTKYLIKGERDYVPWSVANSQLKAIRKLLYLTDEYREFVLYVRQLLDEIYLSVSWNVSGDHLQNLLRVNILRTACEFGHPDALKEVANRFRSWLRQPEIRPNPDLRSVVYTFGMQETGNEKIWEEVWHLFVKESDAQEKLKLMEALAFIKVPWILKRYINLAWNEEYIRRQDYFTCLRYISKNPVGQSLVWDYVRENWPRLIKRFGRNDRNLGRLIPSITSQFSTQTKLEEMRMFFAKYPVDGVGEGGRVQAVEKVKYNIKWLEHNKSQISLWLFMQKKKEKEENVKSNSTEPE